MFIDGEMKSLLTASGMLYVRAALKPFARQIKAAGGAAAFLQNIAPHDDLLVPNFRRARSFWERPPIDAMPSNSGALGGHIAKLPGAVSSRHPSHRFAGLGARVADVLREHDHTRAAFHPIAELARRHDFSMLLIGCVNESPGFSTVHAVQYELGLTRKHLFRYLIRWDIDTASGRKPMVATESPGCSLSFGKFYPYYERDANLVRGEWFGQQFIYIPSARQAMAIERKILQQDPRFVECGRLTCTTCRLRLY